MNHSKLPSLFAMIIVGVMMRAPDARAVTLVTSCGGLNSGSYLLTQNLTAAGNCFTLNGDNITINFGGFTVTGNGTGSAIAVVPFVHISHVNVLRGTITNFVNGIDFANSADQSGATFVQIQSMLIYGVSGAGIRIENSGIIGDNIIHTNGAGIISLGCSNSFIQNISDDNPKGNVIANNCNKKVDNLGF